MIALRRIFRSRFFIKLTHWEYWPFGIVQAPLFFYFPWLSFKAGSFFFFSASNPSILMGGMFGESKFEVLNLIPAELKPKTILQKIPTSVDGILLNMDKGQISFPAIFKPDLGERGWMVRRINNRAEAAQYLKEIKIDFIIQAYVDMPLEFGVFYLRHPNEKNGRVVSIVEKEMLSVAGDGTSTLQQLILEKDRALIHWDSLKVKYSNHLDQVIAKDEKVELVSIGNHCLGTKFLNANARITNKLSDAFDKIAHRIEGFYFGRFDLRASSYEALENGNVMIVELNGCGAEPAHIYDPQFSFFKAMRVLIRHWQNIYEISIQNHAKGTPYITFAEGKSIYRKFKSLTA